MERRASERVSTNIMTTCRVPATPHRATVLDLSHNGCRIRLGDTAVQPGATVHLDFGVRSPVSGQVVWVNARTAGVRFQTPLRSAVAIELGIEQRPASVEVLVEEQGQQPASLPIVLRHWVRRLCGLAT